MMTKYNTLCFSWMGSSTESISYHTNKEIYNLYNRTQDLHLVTLIHSNNPSRILAGSKLSG